MVALCGGESIRVKLHNVIMVVLKFLECVWVIRLLAACLYAVATMRVLRLKDPVVQEVQCIHR